MNLKYCGQIITDASMARKIYSSADARYLAKLVCSNVDSEEVLAQFLLLLTPTTNSGRFSLTFNDILYHAVHDKKEEEILKLLLNGIDNNFIELYDNDEINDEEFNTMIKLVNIEYATMIELIRSGESLESVCGNDNTVFNMCYGKVCLAENVRVSSKIPEDLTFPDLNDDGEMLTHCFGIVEIVGLLARNKRPKHPETGREFSDFTLDILREKLKIEIKLFRRYILTEDG